MKVTPAIVKAQIRAARAQASRLKKMIALLEQRDRAYRHLEELGDRLAHLKK
jgi:hypothetical protein